MPLTKQQVASFVGGVFEQPMSMISGYMGTGVIEMMATALGGSGIKRMTEYVGNATDPNTFPSPDQVANGYIRGFIDRNTFVKVMQAHGVNFDKGFANPLIANLANVHQACFNAMLPTPGLSEVMTLYNQGHIDRGRYEELMRRAGDFRGEYLDWHNYYTGVYTVADALALYNRGKLDDTGLRKELRLATGMDDEHVAGYRELSYLVPGISDIIRFSVREAFNEQAVRDLGLDQEFEQNAAVSFWAAYQGFKPYTANIPGVGQQTVDWARYYWRAHWELPSPTQTYAMLHRLRPSRVWKFRDIIGEVEPVVMQDVESLLKAADYAPKWRRRLAAISYLAIGRTDLRRMHDLGIIDDAELKESYEDLGYSPVDAEALVEFSSKIRDDRKEKEERRRLARLNRTRIPAVLDAYRVGAVGRADALLALQAMDLKDDEAEGWLSGVDLRASTAIVAETVKAIKREFFLGLHPPDALAGLLMAHGIAPPRADQYARLWVRQWSSPRKQAAVGKLLQWYAEGTLRADDLAERLGRMGWSDPDAVQYLAEAERMRATLLARRAAEAARSEKERIRAAKAAAKEEAALRERQRREYSRYAGIAQVKRWLKGGEIGEEEARELLAPHGLPADMLDLHIAEALDEEDEEEDDDDGEE